MKELIRGSFVPPETIQQLRQYDCRIFDLNEEIVRKLSKLDAVLQRCNIRLSNYFPFSIYVNFCYLLLVELCFGTLLFLICFFWGFTALNGVVFQVVTSNQQNIKKKIMMVVGACIFLVAAAQALPLFFGL